VTAPLFIIGAGGFGREVFGIIDALESSGRGPHTTRFIDDDTSVADLDYVDALGSRVVGSVDDLVRRTEPFNAVLAIGSRIARGDIAGRRAHSPVTLAVLVHPDTTIGCNVRLAEDVVVAAGSRLSINNQAGKHVHLDQDALVGRDCSLGDCSRLNPQAFVSGAVTIGRRALIGANATVLQGITARDDAIVDAGAVVSHQVETAKTGMGVSAR